MSRAAAPGGPYPPPPGVSSLRESPAAARNVALPPRLTVRPSERARGPRVEGLARAQKGQRGVEPDQPRKPLRSAVARNDPEIDLGLTEHEALAHDAGVTGHRGLCAAAAEVPAVKEAKSAPAKTVAPAKAPAKAAAAPVKKVVVKEEVIVKEKVVVKK